MSFPVPVLFDLLLQRHGPQHWWPARTMTGMMVGAVLVQNTAWTQASKAVDQLEEHGLLDFAAINDTLDETLWELIRPAGYFRVKTQRLKALARFMAPHEDINSFIHPHNKELRHSLLGIYGIGKETADSILCYAAHQAVFVVDAYTKRLFLRLGWVDEKAVYDQMQAIVHDTMPMEAHLLGEFHALIVHHAKENCLKRPRCQGCPVVICPWTHRE